MSLAAITGARSTEIPTLMVNATKERTALVKWDADAWPIAELSH
jgi:hypothetical protein